MNEDGLDFVSLVATHKATPHTNDGVLHSMACCILAATNSGENKKDFKEMKAINKKKEK